MTIEQDIAQLGRYIHDEGLGAVIGRVVADHARLTARVDELLKAMVKLTRDVPYVEEANTQATLMAEVGTLRSALHEMTAARDELADIAERAQRDAGTYEGYADRVETDPDITRLRKVGA